MQTLSPLSLMACMLGLVSCINDSTTNTPIENLSGKVQKGPYLNGTSITIAELDADLAQTGKTFSTQVVDNLGSFELQNLELTSQFVELRANGFYFNEIKNANSEAQLTLLAISDLTQRRAVNVNLLSHLESARVKHLVGQGVSFSAAKRQAMSELLSLFEIPDAAPAAPEDLDIAQPGEENAVLLAASCILLGYQSTADLSELLANISTDFAPDGIVNDSALGSVLVNNASLIKLDSVRAHLENRYAGAGSPAAIPEFEQYVQRFVDSTDFQFTGGIEYPAAGKHGPNILDRQKTGYSAGNYSMRAVLPEGTTVQVTLIGHYYIWVSVTGEPSGWHVSENWNPDIGTREFSSLKTGDIDMYFKLEKSPTALLAGLDADTGQVEVLVYENESPEPTWSKTITVSGSLPDPRSGSLTANR